MNYKGWPNHGFKYAHYAHPESIRVLDIVNSRANKSQAIGPAGDPAVMPVFFVTAGG